MDCHDRGAGEGENKEESWRKREEGGKGRGKDPRLAIGMDLLKTKEI